MRAAAWAAVEPLQHVPLRGVVGAPGGPGEGAGARAGDAALSAGPRGRSGPDGGCRRRGPPPASITNSPRRRSSLRRPRAGKHGFLLLRHESSSEAEQRQEEARRLAEPVAKQTVYFVT